VVIEVLKSNAEKTGLTKSQLRTDVEVELRKAGIPVLTGDSRDPLWSPYLYVNVNSAATIKGFYAFSISVELYQMADLRQNRSIGIYATTWSRISIAGVGKDNFRKSVRETVRDFVNAFINDYLTVNPK